MPLRVRWSTAAILLGIASVVLCLSFSISSGIVGWPGLHQDAALFATPILNYANDGQWRFTSYTEQLVNRETDEFNRHGQLYQIIFGAILRTKNYESFMFRCGIANAVTYVLYLWLFWLHFHRRKRSYAFVWAAICATVPLSICVNLQGRPEHLIPLFSAMPVLLRMWDTTAQYSRPSLYATAGLVFLLSPVPGVLFSLAVFCWIWLHDNDFAWRESLRAVALASSVVAAVVFGWFRSDALTWLQNTFSAQSGAPVSWWRLVSSPFIFDVPFWNGVILCLITALVVALARRSRPFVLLIVITVGFVLLPSAQIYSYAGLLPIGFLTFIEYGSPVGYPTFRGILSTVATCSFLANVIAFARTIVLLAYCMTNGVSFQDARLAVSPFNSEVDLQTESMGFLWMGRPSFVVLGDATNPWIAAQENVLTPEGDQLLVKFERKFNRRIAYIVMPEKGHYRSQPPASIQQDQFELVNHNWSSLRPKILGVKLGGTMPGYQFAIYRRKSPSPLRTDERVKPQ